MQQDEIRLECLKLAVRRDKSVAECVADAQTLEAYVNGGAKEQQDGRPTISLHGNKKPTTQRAG